jgi:hypothetical protein
MSDTKSPIRQWPPDDDEVVFQLVEDDTTKCFEPFFTPDRDSRLHGFSIVDVVTPNRNPLRNVTGAAVAWSFTARHTGMFESIEPSGREITATGLTILHVGERGQPQVRRYIDWHHIFAQLGSLPGRATSAPTATVAYPIRPPIAD